MKKIFILSLILALAIVGLSVKKYLEQPSKPYRPYSSIEKEFDYRIRICTSQSEVNMAQYMGEIRMKAEDGEDIYDLVRKACKETIGREGDTLLILETSGIINKAQNLGSNGAGGQEMTYIKANAYRSSIP